MDGAFPSTSLRFPASCWHWRSGSFRNRREASFDSQKETPERATLLGLARNPAFWTVTLGMAAGTFSLGGIQVWMPTFLSRARGYSLESANLIFGEIVVIDGILASLAGGWLGDKLLPRMKGSYYFVSAVSMGLGVPVMIVALFNKGPSMVPAIAVAAFLLLFNTSPLNTALGQFCRRAHPRHCHRGQYLYLSPSGRCSFANPDGLCRRQALAAGGFHPSRYRHGRFFCHIVLRNAIRSSGHEHRERPGDAGVSGGMSYFHWIAGFTLGLCLDLASCRRGVRCAENRRYFPSGVGP